MIDVGSSRCEFEWVTKHAHLMGQHLVRAPNLGSDNSLH